MKNILFLSLTFFCSAAFAENKSVTVFDGEFKKINELTQPKDIEAFYSLWQTKVASDKKIRMDWSKGFKIDISGGNDSGRWLYRGGWLMPLAKSASVGLYQIQNYKQFELVLGITHNKSMVYRPSKLGLDSLTLAAH
ncbi:hypothetical protein [Microbulbifer sp. PSTR4-B]|uniref:hypothetical protein n=1 Tax=Microbulbifer sp. PSTR4-B TaxID=3243396 RepID=UPI00403A1E39